MTRMTSFRSRSGLRLGALGLALALAGCGASPEATAPVATCSASACLNSIFSGSRRCS